MRDYRIFVLGVIVLGGFFGAVVFYNSPELWIPAPDWNIWSSLLASLLLTPVVIFSFHGEGSFNFRAFFAALILCGALVMWIDVDYGTVGPIGFSNSDSVGSLLNSIQIVSSWQYRLFILGPIITTVFVQWVCGVFSLSLMQKVTNNKETSTGSSARTLLITTLTIIVFCTVTIACTLLIKSGPIYILLTNKLDSPEHLWDNKTVRLKEEILAGSDAIKSIDIFQAQVDVAHDFANSIFRNFILFEINQHDNLLRGKWRQSVINSLKGYENDFIAVLQNPVRPLIPSQDSYLLVENNFILDLENLTKSGFEVTELPDDVAAKLRMLSEARLPEITIEIEGQTIPLASIGHVEKVQKKYHAAELPTPYWTLFSRATEAAPTGVIITLDENHIKRFGLSLSAIERTIIEYIEIQTSPIDIPSLQEMVLITFDNGQFLKLADIASVYHSSMDDRYRTINGNHFDIKLQ